MIPTPLHVLGRISPIFSPSFPVFCAFSPSRRDGSNEPQAGTQGQETADKTRGLPSIQALSAYQWDKSTDRLLGAARLVKKTSVSFSMLLARTASSTCPTSQFISFIPWPHTPLTDEPSYTSLLNTEHGPSSDRQTRALRRDAGLADGLLTCMCAKA